MNGAMEQGSNTINNNNGNIIGLSPDYWFDNSDWATPSPVLRYTLDTGVPRTPTSARSWCVQVVSEFAQAGQSIVLTPATDYALSVWFMVKAAPSSSTPVTVEIALQAGFSPWNWYGYASTQITVLSGWTQLTLRNLTQPTGADPSAPTTAPAMMALRVMTPGVTVCMDDAQVTLPCECCGFNS